MLYISFALIAKEYKASYIEVELVLLFMYVNHGQWKAMNLLGFFHMYLG